ncbi:uncharacterized protein LOC144474726 isoform X3 [Augochlora pura]
MNLFPEDGLDINTDYKNSCKTSGQGKRLSEMWEKRFLDSDKIRKEISDVREMKKMRNKIGNKMNFKIICREFKSFSFLFILHIRHQKTLHPEFFHLLDRLSSALHKT